MASKIQYEKERVKRCAKPQGELMRAQQAKGLIPVRVLPSFKAEGKFVCRYIDGAGRESALTA